MSTCGFISSQLKRCIGPIVANHKYCLFHSSLYERERHGLKTPKWFHQIVPKLDDTHLHFDEFPKDRYDYYDFEFSEGYKPYTKFKSSEQIGRMPETGCRFMMTVGKFRGYYCARNNQMGSDFCPFHKSVTEILVDDDYPMPIWTQCIRPSEIDAQQLMFTFPWSDYDLNNLLFLDLITAPKNIPKVIEPVVIPKTILAPVPKKIPPPISKPSRPLNSSKKKNKINRKIQILQYTRPGSCGRPDCDCDTIIVPVEVVPFEPRQNLYRELDHNYIVKEKNQVITVYGIYDEELRKMRPLNDEEETHAKDIGFFV